ncbi:hypothetical protein OIU77_011754 [Salix suchowensis]|uniref:Imidazoleglycerol-phosphate dehydratase n=1 Tax=Salix suchowensis TaxID=1278906 RepID=A0ABQ9A1D0_9ROSI|nr:hypothetical protein OIU77_011754 [Salix suchowensis]KAJ6351240.1 hypothetical protein OIU78_007207 [Salix suchowensis]
MLKNRETKLPRLVPGRRIDKAVCGAACTGVGEMKRVTNETNVEVKFNLDGTGIADSTTVIPFLDHMLDQRS